MFPSKKLYKFSGFTEYSISALASSSVWFSPIKEMNDPFEAFCTLKQLSFEEKEQQYKELAKTLEDDSSVVDRRYRNNPHEFIAKTESLVNVAFSDLKKRYDSLSVFSASMDTLEFPPYACMLMWSHYGKALSGYCLEFDSEELYSSIKLQNNRIFWGAVDYVATPYEIDPVSLFSSTSYEFIKPILCKHRNWHYEQELRLLSNESGLHRFSKKSLKSIYYGDKMPHGQVNVLRAVVNAFYPDVKIIEVSISKNGYGVELREIKI
ncbi:DUF2971 domain-containing protein [Vibrio cholerae]|uniref:DUF2971 domain-containing protein n=1 Tax=Vibrio cholerae TaxID=666 RepID=UPI0030804E3D|nr:DUF2971 domain-containing protein [Vibrio cholerae]